MCDTPKPAKRKKSKCKKSLSKKIDPHHQNKKDVKIVRRQKYECKKCFQKTFLTLKGLQSHQSQVHGGMKHTKNVHEGKNYECKICNEDFKDSQNLKNHEKQVHNGKSHLCTICNKTFSHKGKLDYHIKVIHGGNKSSLLQHTKNVHESKKYECEICKQSFMSLEGLKIHQTLVHDDEINNSKKFNQKKWVEDALNLPDVEEILDEDESDLETSIVIDPDLGPNHLLL